MRCLQILALSLQCCLAGIAIGQSLSSSDRLLVLVEGTTQSTSMFGYSGKASMYQSIGTNADGTISFTLVPGASGVDVERNSATDFTNFSNYGTKGFIPPGIYYLHYHRLDTSLGRIRHRLGLSDRPGAETILSTAPNPPVTRMALQFHVAFNDLASFQAHVSEGCITLSENNFMKLFPSDLFTASKSPLAVGANDANPLGLAGSTASVLVFVTDVLTSGKQDQQLKLFQLIKGQLKPNDFSNSTTIQTLRAKWR